MIRMTLIAMLFFSSCGADPASGLLSTFGDFSEAEDSSNNSNESSDAVQRRGTIIGNGNKPKDTSKEGVLEGDISNDEFVPGSQNGAPLQLADYNIEGLDEYGNISIGRKLNVSWTAIEGASCTLKRRVGVFLPRTTVLKRSQAESSEQKFSEQITNLQVFKVILECEKGDSSQVVFSVQVKPKF